jgi:hypothetical protein
MYDYRADLTRLRGYWHALFFLLYVRCLVYKACAILILGLFVTPVLTSVEPSSKTQLNDMLT